MTALFGPSHPALNQYRDLFARTAARRLSVSDFSWRLTPSGAVGRGALALQLHSRGQVAPQRYTGFLQVEIGRQGGRLYLKQVNYSLRASPAAPNTSAPDYGRNG